MIRLHEHREHQCQHDQNDRGDHEQLDQGKAALAIWDVGPDASTLPVLINALNKSLDDKEPFVRQPVCLALSKFGPEAKAAVPYLLKASEDEDPMVKKSALEALRNIDPNSLTPERLKSLQPRAN